MKRNTRATAVVALCLTTTMSLAACGRSTVSSGTSTTKAAAVSSGKATGTITVWAMGGVAIDMALVRAGLSTTGGNHLEIQVS